ncbi:MAG: hypothetical protein F4Z79_10340 [Acidimicrobiia bacterium]|nr:hypothetical protein [bacterium]MXX01991.1 hypothetical protein [Acidimicrobiia bacterium]MYB79116.1 hypothetical protein [Acidimicrobiia bacterium]
MNLRGWVVLVAVVMVVGAVMWRPTGPTVQVPTEVGWVRTQGRLLRLVEVYGVPVAVAAVALWWLRSAALAAAVGMVAWGCVAMWRAAREIRRSVSMAASMAVLTTVLAGQARTAHTVEEAVGQAGTLVSGPVAEAAAELGRTVGSRGIAAAAGTFMREVDAPAAEWLGMILVKASTGGGRWADAVRILRAETVQEAEILRELRKQVAAKMPTAMFMLAAGAATVGVSGWLYPEVGAWIAGPGDMIVLAASVIAGLNAKRIAGAATAFLRT